MTKDESVVEDEKSDEETDEENDEKREGESKRDSEGEEIETTLNQVSCQL